jgi:hypothetical protein
MAANTDHWKDLPLEEEARKLLKSYKITAKEATDLSLAISMRRIADIIEENSPAARDRREDEKAEAERKKRDMA